MWEHKAIEIHCDVLLKVINEFGADRWELVQVGQPYQHIPTDINMTLYYLVWFKRRRD